MIIKRKFNLGRISPDYKYESIEITVEGENTYEMLTRIQAAWHETKQAIIGKKVE